MKRVTDILLVCISLFFCSCGKDSIFSAGPIVTKTVQFDYAFKCVEMHDDVNVTLKHADLDHRGGTVVIEAGSNLIDKISIDTTDPKSSTMVISNQNIADWIRPFGSTIKATVYYDSIQKIIFESNGNLNTDTLLGILEMTKCDTTIYNADGTSYDTTLYIYKRSVHLEIIGGAGDINIQTNSDRFYTDYRMGTASANLYGSTRIAYTYTEITANGPVNAEELDTEIHFITAYGTNQIGVKAFSKISAYNYNIGYIRYLEYIGHEKYWVNNIAYYRPVTCPKSGIEYNGTTYLTTEYTNGTVDKLIKDLP